MVSARTCRGCAAGGAPVLPGWNMLVSVANLLTKIVILERKIEVKNIDRIRSMNESELAEFLQEASFDCANRCPDFDCGCLRTCTHGAGIDIIREWLETEIAT